MNRRPMSWELDYPEWRRKKAKWSLIFITIFIIIVICIISFLGGVINNNSKVNSSKHTKKETKSNIKYMDPYETCVDGKKVVIIKGVYYYAGTVDSWDDIKVIKCEEK